MSVFGCGCVDVRACGDGCVLFLLKLEKFLFILTTCFLLQKDDSLDLPNYLSLREPKETCFYDNGICNSLLNS